MIRTYAKGTEMYNKLVAVAAILEANSPNNARYIVQDVYYDYGAEMMWTTIVRRGFRECQILSPADVSRIYMADTFKQLMGAVEEIRNGKWFGDK